MSGLGDAAKRSCLEVVSSGRSGCSFQHERLRSNSTAQKSEPSVARILIRIVDCRDERPDGPLGTATKRGCLAAYPSHDFVSLGLPEPFLSLSLYMISNKFSAQFSMTLTTYCNIITFVQLSRMLRLV